jgi:hypothetical protein
MIGTTITILLLLATANLLVQFGRYQGYVASRIGWQRTLRTPAIILGAVILSAIINSR